MSELQQWAEDHQQRAQLERTLNVIRGMWKTVGMGETRLMSGPQYVLLGVDLGKDEETKPAVILPGKVQQQQEQNQDGSEGKAEVHDAQPGERAR